VPVSVRNIIPFDLYHWFQPDTSLVENAYALRALLDCLISLNQAYLKYNPSTYPLYKSGVVYHRTDEWLPIPALYKQGFGDCKSLACALIAEYRHNGISCEPAFRWKVRNKTPELVRDFHILVEVRNGFEDPSKVLGMGVNENGPIEFIAAPALNFGALETELVKANLKRLRI
jgi:hypothetical protein